MAKDRILPWSPVDTLVAFACSACSLLLSLSVAVRRPDLVEGADFLFQDAGHNLLTAHAILAGQTLYRDLFFPYGPLSAYAYAAVAWMFGNTPAVYLGLLAAVSALNAALAYILIRRCSSTGVAAGVSVGALALLPIPGAIAGAFASSPVIVLERTALLLTALAWAAPDTRRVRRAIALGVVFGVWQWVKFGGAFVGGGAVVMLDLLCLMTIGWSAARVSAWCRSLLITLATFLALEGVLAIYAFATQPRAIAYDVIWPYFMFHAYAVVGSDIRWLAWGGWRLMIGQYLLPLTGAGLSIAGLAGWLTAMRRRGASDSSGACFLLVLFYGVASFGYFHHIFHFQQFFWALVPPAAFALGRASLRTRAAAAAAWAPGVLMVVHSAALTQPPASAQTVRLPTGGQVVVSPAIAERLRFLQRVESEVGGAPILYAPVGSGWHYAYGVPTASRHTFFFAPDVIRPYEREAFVRSVDRLGALIACGDRQAAPAIDTQLPLDGTVRPRVFDRLQLWQSGAGCNVYRVRSQLR